MGKILSKDPVNTGRQFEIDIARGLAVFFMIAVHTMMLYSTKDFSASLTGEIINFFGSPPAAPVFMFLLGIGIVYSRKTEPALLMKRGLILICVGYLLNVLRLGIPLYIHYLKTSNNTYLVASYSMAMMTDIFQFAGLTFIFFGLVKKFNLGVVSLSILGLAFGIINLFLLEVQFQQLILSAITGLFWGSSKTSFFPFLTWIVYPISGYVFGTFLIRCNDKSGFYTLITPASAVLTVLLTFLFTHFLNLEIELDGDLYYHHNILAGIIYTLFSIFWIGLLFFITKMVAISGVVRKTMERWSKNVSEIYFISWILICWGTIFTGLNPFGTLPTFVLIVIFVILSDALAYSYVKLKARKSELTGQ